MISQVSRLRRLNGNDLMSNLKIEPGPKIGQILDILLGYVLDDPKKNKKEFLEKEASKLSKLTEKELKELSDKSKEEKFEVESKQDQSTKEKYWVK